MDFICDDKGAQSFVPGMSLAMMVVCRGNYLLEALDPADNIAWQELCKAFSETVVGSPMPPAGVVVCLIAHVIRWPPAIRFFHL